MEYYDLGLENHLFNCLSHFHGKGNCLSYVNLTQNTQVERKTTLTTIKNSFAELLNSKEFACSYCCGRIGNAETDSRSQ